tara:strand:+ start:51 stop:2237 length:2187 start_codon:yes stop_codon:yes gene_type:complete
MNEDDLTQEDIDAYNKRRQEEYDEATKGNEEIRKRREGEGTRGFRDRISGGTYKNKKPKFETDDDIRKRIQAQDKKIAEERKQEQLDQDPELNKQREDMNQGDFLQDPEEGFQGNAFLSAGFEITANTILDLFSPILPLQSGGSYAINLISQIIRDPSKIGSLNQLEAGAAAASSLIPGANQYASFLKGIKPATRGTQLARQVGRGAVSANLDMLGMRIGEGEEVTFEDLTAATVFGGGLGGIVGVTPELIKGKGGDLSKVFTNIRKRIDGTLPGNERITPQGFNLGKAEPEFEPSTVFAMGRKPTPKPSPGQKNIFTEARENPSLGQSDKAINEQYQALYKKYDDRTIGDTIDANLTNKQKRKKYSRKLQSTDLDLIIQEEGLKGNTIPPEKAQEYVDLVNESRLGKKEYITIDGKQRLRRNNKGFIGTISYLNAVSLGVNPKNLKGQVDVINHISKELGTDAVGLKKIIEGQGGEITFQTEGMKQPVKIRSLPELVKAYMTRLQRYKEIPAFEKGHFFAADNIINDMDINSLTDFLNQLDPEISRSIREQLDDKAIEELIKVKGTDKGVDFYRSLVDGNRKRKNKQDPDKILADLLGTQYGLRESFLTFVYPERSLSNIIPEDSKAAFAELYRKELLAEIKGLKADLRINKGQSSIGPATIDQLKLDVARSVAKGMKNNKILNEIIVMDNKINKVDMTEQGQAKPLPDDPIKKDPDGLVRGDTPDQ